MLHREWRLWSSKIISQWWNYLRSAQIIGGYIPWMLALWEPFVLWNIEPSFEYDFMSVNSTCSFWVHCIPLLEFNKALHRRATFSVNFSADTFFGGLCQRNRQVFGVVHRHTKTYERADFNLLTPNISCRFYSFLTWCRPTWRVSGKLLVCSRV